MKNSLLPTALPLRSAFVCLTRPVRFSTLAFISFLSASIFADPPAPPAGIAGGAEVFDISKLDRAPELKFRVQAQYPFEMRRAGATGEVIVEFIVDTNGNVMNAFAVRSSRSEFEANAVSAVSKWKFKPGQKGGRNLNTRMQVPIVFTLNQE
jgi:periplasmic protein TonB